MEGKRLSKATHNRIRRGEALEFGVVHAGAAVVLSDFVVPPIAGEAVGVVDGFCIFVFKERAERVVGIIILHSARIVDQHSNAAETVVQVVIYITIT